MIGAAGTALIVSIVQRIEIVGWYAAAAAAVYLFVAGRWEGSRALDLEEQYAPIPPRIMQQETQPVTATGYDLEAGLEGLLLEDATSESSGGKGFGARTSPPVDIDEILRKLHREGVDSLSLIEQQALLTASRELQQKRSKG